MGPPGNPLLRIIFDLGLFDVNVVDIIVCFLDRAQHLRFTNQILECRHFHHEEPFHSWYSIWKAHQIAYSWGLSYIWLRSNIRRDRLTVLLVGHLDHLSIRAIEMMCGWYGWRIVHTWGNGSAFWVPIPPQGALPLKRNSFPLPAEGIRTRTRSVCVPHLDGYGTKWNRCHSQFRRIQGSKGVSTWVGKEPAVNKSYR